MLFGNILRVCRQLILGVLPLYVAVVLFRTACYIGRMNRFETTFSKAGEATLKYLDADYQVIKHGQFVRCAVTGKPIKLEELRYWSVERQEAYTSAKEAMQRKMELES